MSKCVVRHSATEKRAQEAEEKIFDLEDQLNTALEKIRVYDRQVILLLMFT